MREPKADLRNRHTAEALFQIGHTSSKAPLNASSPNEGLGFRGFGFGGLGEGSRDTTILKCSARDTEGYIFGVYGFRGLHGRDIGFCDSWFYTRQRNTSAASEGANCGHMKTHR